MGLLPSHGLRMSTTVTTAFILAAGRGERLRPLTLLRAKPAVPFLNRPLIHNSLQLLSTAGIKSLVINTHHLPDSIKEAVGSFQSTHLNPFSSLKYSHEERLLGTAGAIHRARRWLQGETIVVCSGKIYFEGSLEPAIRSHQEQASWVTLVLVPLAQEDPYNPVFLDRQDNIVGFGKAHSGRPGLRAFGFTGIHILNRNILDWIPAGPSETVRDLYPRLLAGKRPVRGFVTNVYWCECSTPARYLEKSLEVLARSGRSHLMARELPPCPQVISGPSVSIESGSEVRRSVLWGGVRVGRNASLQDTIVTSGVEIPPGSRIRKAVVTPESLGQEKPSDDSAQSSRVRVWPL